MYKPYIDENNRLHIFCLCDGTYIFLLQLVKVLAEMGCSDIHTNGDIVTEGIPEDKPWCNYLFEASGILPDEAVEIVMERLEALKDGNVE